MSILSARVSPCGDEEISRYTKNVKPCAWDDNGDKEVCSCRIKLLEVDSLQEMALHDTMVR